MSFDTTYFYSEEYISDIAKELDCHILRVIDFKRSITTNTVVQFYSALALSGASKLLIEQYKRLEHDPILDYLCSKGSEFYIADYGNGGETRLGYGYSPSVGENASFKITMLLPEKPNAVVADRATIYFDRSSLSEYNDTVGRRSTIKGYFYSRVPFSRSADFSFNPASTDAMLFWDTACRVARRANKTYNIDIPPWEYHFITDRDFYLYMKIGLDALRATKRLSEDYFNKIYYGENAVLCIREKALSRREGNAVELGFVNYTVNLGKPLGRGIQHKYLHYNSLLIVVCNKEGNVRVFY